MQRYNGIVLMTEEEFGRLSWTPEEREAFAFAIGVMQIRDLADRGCMRYVKTLQQMAMKMEERHGYVR